jgi:periodic tryptophan protein 2
LCVTYRPDGKQIAAASLGGTISFWDVELGSITRLIEGKQDLFQGRLALSKTRAKNVHFNSITYSADGEFIIGGGDSKYVCIYNIESQTLLKRFTLSKNKSFDGVLAKQNSKKMTEAGNIDLIDDEDYSDREDRIDNSLPGQQRRTDPSDRSTPLIMRVTSVKFSPTGRSFACATTQGLVVYSLDDYMMFDPFDLEVDVTPDSIKEACANQDWLRALIYSLKIGEVDLQVGVMNCIPSDVDVISLIVRDVPVKYLDRLLKFLVVYSEGPRLEFSLEWVNIILRVHVRYVFYLTY